MTSTTSGSAAPLPSLEARLPRGARTSLLWILAGALAAAVVTLLPIDLAPIGKKTLAIFVFTIVMWVGDVVPTGIAAVLWAGLLVLSLGKAMPAATIFSGFTSDTIWLMVGAFLIGQATTETGLAKRIAYTLMVRGGASYGRAILYMWIAMFVVGAFVPSATVRVAIFIPIMYAIGAAFNVARDKTFAANLFLNVYWSSTAAEGLWYTASVPNVISFGVLQQLTGFHQTWIGWLIIQIVPVALFTLGTYLITNRVFRPHVVDTDAATSQQALQNELTGLGPTTPAEWRAGSFFVLAALLWALEPIIHLPNAWTAAFIGAALFVPGIGVLDEKSLGRISWNSVLLMGIALGIGSVMSTAKVDVFFLQHLLNPIFAPLAGFGTMGLAFGIGVFSFIFHFIIPSGAAQAGTLSPLLLKFAISSGFDPRVVAFVIPRSVVLFLFPYESVPIMILWGTGFLDMKRCILSMAVMCVFMLAWLVVMAPYWGWISHLLNF